MHDELQLPVEIKMVNNRDGYGDRSSYSAGQFKVTSARGDGYMYAL